MLEVRYRSEHGYTKRRTVTLLAMRQTSYRRACHHYLGSITRTVPLALKLSHLPGWKSNAEAWRCVISIFLDFFLKTAWYESSKRGNMLQELLLMYGEM